MAGRVEMIAAFLGLAVLLSIIRLMFSSSRVSTVASPTLGMLAEPSADARALIEELRLLRSDISALQTSLRPGSGSIAGADAPAQLQVPLATTPEPQQVAPMIVEGKHDGSLLLAVITNPAHIAERALVRQFYKDTFADDISSGRVRVVFVVGRNYYLGNPPKPMPQTVKEVIQKVMVEAKQEGDIVWVDGRENLPHVGKATEKSAAWWQTAPSLGNYGYYCKSDDDSLIHISRLRRDLEAAGESVLYGYVAFRGWKPNYKFQACGIDARPSAVEQALHGVDMHRDENCSDSVGPFPYAGGNLVCMGSNLSRQLAADPHFAGFVAKAHTRNDNGIKCHSPLECARQPFNVHMWHHEDAGISYNLFRSILRGGLRNVKVVKIQSWVHIQHWLRGDNLTLPIPLVVIHNLKGLKQLQNVTADWRTDLGPWEYEDEKIVCSRCDDKGWGWKWSRTCCESDGDTCVRACDVDPNDTYMCCTKQFPSWVMDRLRQEEAARTIADKAARAAKEKAKKAAKEAAAAKVAAAKVAAASPTGSGTAANSGATLALPPSAGG